MAYLLYTVAFIQNAAFCIVHVSNVFKVSGAAYGIAKLINTPNMVLMNGTITRDSTATDDDYAGSVKLEDVQFAYPTKSESKVLKGVNIEVEKNQVVAIVGQSGCGKSSVVSLIERFYDP